jgi:hypothetical protein
VLVGSRTTITGRCGDAAPAIYRLRARLRTRSLVDQFIPSLKDFLLSTVVVIETGKSISASGTPAQSGIYEPSLPLGNRVRWRDTSLIPG